MKLRIASAASLADGPPGLMLSPDGRDWCSVDGGCAGGTLRPAAIVLTGCMHERVSPLLDLRHGEPINLYATPAVFEHLTLALPVLPVLQQYCGVCWHLLAVAGEQQEADFSIDSWPQWSFTALHMQAAPDRAGGGDHPLHRAGGAIALSVRDSVTGKHLLVLPFVPAPAPAAAAWGDADCIVVCDGAALEEDNRQGESAWACMQALPAQRKLVFDRPQMSALAARHGGIEVAHAGMALQL
jgi:pyrroloquinoline quinone biosynthesis protein B